MAKTNPLTRTTPKLSAYGIVVRPTIEDLVRIRKEGGIRLTKSPFVDDYDVVAFPGRSARWKGAKGIAEVEAINPRVASGLRAAQSISKACAGVHGAIRVGNRFLSNKAICEIEKSKHGEASPA